MQIVGEIALPETKPETEWIGDRPVQKVSPTRKHSVLQLAFANALEAWAGDRGDAGTEWRFRASPPGEDIHPLVPDVAYMSYERLRPLSAKDRETPPIAPEIVVEILSPDDRQKDVDEKRRVYFAWGVTLELMRIGDPDNPRWCSLCVFDGSGRNRNIAWLRIPSELDPWREPNKDRGDEMQAAIAACRAIFAAIPVATDFDYERFDAFRHETQLAFTKAMRISFFGLGDDEAV